MIMEKLPVQAGRSRLHNRNMDLNTCNPVEAGPAQLQTRLTRDWQQLERAHAKAVQEEERAYEALRSASASRSDLPGHEADVDSALLAEWVLAKEAVTIAWERLHRHAVGVDSMF